MMRFLVVLPIPRTRDGIRSVEMTNRTEMSFRTEWNECEKTHFLARQFELKSSRSTRQNDFVGLVAKCL